MGDAVARLDAAKERALFDRLLASHANDARRNPRSEVAIERDRELCLRRVALDDAVNRGEARERRGDQFIAETARVRPIDQFLQPRLEWTRGRFRHTRGCLLRHQNRRRQEQSSQSHGNLAERS